MEHKNPRKIVMFLAIALIAILFVCGIIFTLIANARYDQANNFNNRNDIIKEYDDKLPDAEGN